MAAPGSRGQGWLAQGRSEVIARHGIVATSDPLAAQAGLEILQQGGNAIDAAVAAAAVLDVTSQNDTGLAGDLFALVWSAEDQKLYALNSAGFAPAGWTPEFFKEELGLNQVPGRGVNAATVPGAVSGYDALLERFGTMGFAETFERAARIAEQGWGNQSAGMMIWSVSKANCFRMPIPPLYFWMRAKCLRCTASSEIPAWLMPCV